MADAHLIDSRVCLSSLLPILRDSTHPSPRRSLSTSIASFSSYRRRVLSLSFSLSLSPSLSSTLLLRFPSSCYPPLYATELLFVVPLSCLSSLCLPPSPPIYRRIRLLVFADIFSIIPLFLSSLPLSFPLSLLQLFLSVNLWAAVMLPDER